MTHRSGFACLVGRPNVGKSTLVNAMAGTKVVITSDRPQTTRHTVRAVLTRQAGQLIVIDTPGLHRPRTVLGERLNDAVRATWAEVDAVVLCLPADQPPGPGDRFIAGELTSVRARAGRSVFLAVTKFDLAGSQGPAIVDRAYRAVSDAGLSVAEVVPVSAIDGTNVDTLTDVLIAALPEGPQLYDPDTVTDEPEDVLVAELIREAALDGARQELPHSIAVTVEEMAARPDRPEDEPLVDIYATIHVERDSQKPMIIGRGGSRLRDIGQRSRSGIETLLGTPVYLNLHVRVAKDWQRDPKQLRRLGF